MKLTRRHFFLLIVTIYFTFIGGTFYSQLNFPLRVTHQVIVTAILGLWLAGRIRQGKGLPATVLDGPIALYLLVNLLSALLGQSPRFSLEMMWFTLGHVLALYRSYPNGWYFAILGHVSIPTPAGGLNPDLANQLVLALGGIQAQDHVAQRRVGDFALPRHKRGINRLAIR